jgi:hypothetical protein
MEGKLRTLGDAMILGAVGSWDQGEEGRGEEVRSVRGKRTECEPQETSQGSIIMTFMIRNESTVLVGSFVRLGSGLGPAFGGRYPTRRAGRGGPATGTELAWRYQFGAAVVGAWRRSHDSLSALWL